MLAAPACFRQAHQGFLSSRRCSMVVAATSKPKGAGKTSQQKQAVRKHVASRGGASSQPGKFKPGRTSKSKPSRGPSKARGKAAKETHTSQLMEVMIEEHLTPLDPAIQPLWATFCGLTNGVWQGRVAAFFAATGEPEPVYMDGKTPCFDLHTLAVEERPEDDKICRKVLRSPKLSVVRNASLAAADEVDSVAERAVSSAAASTSGRGLGTGSRLDAKRLDDHWQEDFLVEEEEGLIFFDGGTFSRGPHWLLNQPPATEEPESDREQLERQILLQADDEDAIATSAKNGAGATIADGVPEADGNAAEPDEFEPDEIPRKTSVIEQCLAWGGEQRLRLQLTLCVGAEDGELDVEVLRLLLWRESWQGLAQECLADRCIPGSSNDAADEGTLLSTAPRTGVKAFEGRWKVFDVSAVPVDDTDPLIGESSKIAVYFSQETRQRWNGGRGGLGDDGAAIWLPNQVLLEVRMISPSSRGAVGDAEEGMDEEDRRGFMIGFSWAVKNDTVIGVHREYDERGELLEVRSRTAVRGSWVGGQM